MGYSLGGGAALRTAIQHPELVRKLVVVSTTFRRDGWYPEVLAAMGHGQEDPEGMKQTPRYQAYSKVAPRLEDWPVLMTKLGEMLRREYDWSAEVAEMKTPTMIVVGDADSVRTTHAVEFFELLGGGKKDAAGTGRGCPERASPSCPGPRTSPYSPIPRWRRPSYRSSTRRYPGDPRRNRLE